jgi:hypothetical protein
MSVTHGRIVPGRALFLPARLGTKARFDSSSPDRRGMVDTPQKRDRERRKREKRQDKDARRRERSEFKRTGQSAPSSAHPDADYGRELDPKPVTATGISPGGPVP